MLTVHVGLHKTGSTSIQTVLSLERGHVRRRQVYLRWNDLFVTDGTIRTSNVAKIIALSRRGWHVVVSSEGALGAMVHSYPRAAGVGEELAHLFSEIPLRVVMYLRPHHDWAVSALRQHRTEGGTTEADAFARGLLSSRGFHHAALVYDLSEALPSGGLIVRPYHSQMDVVQDFFDHCDLGPVPPAMADLRANESRSGHSDSPVNPFSAEVQDLLLRHFRADWGALLDSRLQAVAAVRRDLMQLREGAVAATPAADSVAVRGDAAIAQTIPGRASQRREPSMHRMMQTTVWAVRHGPRQRLLSGLVARDAAERNLLTARRARAGGVLPARESQQASSQP